MGILSWLLFGGLAGWVGSLIAGTDHQMGIVRNVIAGIIGAFVGGLAMSLFGSYGVTGFNLRSFLVAAVGAVITIFVARRFW